ncbi:flagellar filament capping protein FliD [Tunturibacter empetritectus]|uniref:Flagellar hook-associated protein 2 n=1 Tax=Tunturiibacter lichenicola TaxID=2051959 RepID=A0A7W8N5P9_9BACT|nr:flagellar filament capping protein FliD [Edaphobacter lichenicola]MBB5344240.1 flagellar hook-associated protein 2 [Edaphobacter lichenicola]
MGTVGLSFGSATSGQGFDVATTVTAIQASEQAIETPWKNQLTTLQAQDTVFSGLGTDLGSLTTALQSLTDFNGVFAEKQGSSSNTDLLSLTSAGSSAVAGSHTVTITQLAQTSSDVSTGIPSASDTLTGTVTIQGKVFDTATNGSNTLTGLAAAINSAAIGVTASVITDSSGSRLSLVSGTSGAAGQLAAITSTLADGATSITFPGPPNSGQQGQDAQITVDGVHVTSPSNTVTGAISGVTFQLLSSASPGTQVQVQVTDNTTDIETAVSNFVSAYNTVVKDINTEETNSSTGTAPALLGSPILAQLQSQLTGALFGGSASGSINNFGQLGISLNNDGTLTLDSSTLSSALSSNLSDVTGFFQSSGSFGQTLTTAVNNLGTQAPNGAIYLAQQQNAAQEKALNADIANEDTLLSEQKTQLTNELNAANQILQSIPSQLNQVNEIYSAVTGFNQNPSG